MRIFYALRFGMEYDMIKEKGVICMTHKRLIASILIMVMALTILEPCAFANRNTRQLTPNFPDGRPVLVRAKNTDYADSIVQEELDVASEPHTETLDYEIEMEVCENTDDGVSTFASTNSSVYDYEKWRQIYSDTFGDTYIAPNTVNESSATIQGSTNRLVVTETDLYLPGRNGLDLSIRRRHDNQEFKNIPIVNESYGDVAIIRTCYAFSNSLNERIYIAFLTPDDMYRFMYDGAYICLDGLETISANKTDEEGNSYTINYYTFEDIMPEMSDIQFESSVFYSLDSDFEEVQVQENLEDELDMISSIATLPLSCNEIGAGWYYDVPEVYMYAYYSELYLGDNGKRDKENYYTAAFRDIYGKIHSFNGSLREYRRNESSEYVYTSSLESDINDGLEYTRFFEHQTLADGTEYNFTVCDRINGITYYMYNTNNNIGTREQLYILKVADNYGNSIDYAYDEESEKISKITDTYGRVINLSQQGISYYDAYEEETKTITYTLETLPASVLNNNSDVKNMSVTRMTVTNPIGESTIYDMRSACVIAEYVNSSRIYTINQYVIPDGMFTLRLSGYNIERITYPSGLQTDYTYSLIYPYSIRTELRRSVYAVSEVSSTDGTRVANRRTFTFEDPVEIKVTETDSSGNTTLSEHDEYGKLLIATRSSSGDTGTKYVEVYTYDDDGMPSKTTSYHKFGYNYSSHKVEEYYYSGSFLYTKYINDLKVDYTYHTGDIRAPKTITYSKKNTNNTYTPQYIEETTLNENGSVEYKYTKRADGSIINQQKYEYDEYGDVSAVYTWISDDNWDGIADMDDTYKVTRQDITLNEDGTLNVRIYVEDVLDADGVNVGDYSMTYQLDMFGNPVKQTDSYGKISTIEYDDISRPVKYTLPDNTEIEIEYNSLNNYTTITDQIGGKTRYVYDAWNNVKEKQYKDGASWLTTEDYIYDGNNRVSEKRLYRYINQGTKETYTYDFLSRVSNKTTTDFPYGVSISESTDYDVLSDGNIKETVWITGQAPIHNVYDAYGRLLSTVQDYEEDAPKETYTYDYMDRILTITNAEGGVTEYYYNEIENMEGVMSPDGYIEQYVYDLAGRVVTELYPYTFETYTFDNMDRKIITVDDNLDGNPSVVKTYYDLNSNVVKTKTKITDENYREEEFKYDDVGRLLGQIVVGDTDDLVTQYEYDDAGRMLKMITGLTQYSENPTGGKETEYEYTPQGFVSKITDPMGNSEHYLYDLQGNVADKTDRNGINSYYSYDIFGMTTETVDNEPTIYYNYVPGMSMNVIEQGNKQYFQYHDGKKRIESESYGNIYNTYTYDDNSNITGISISVGDETYNLSYSYDTANKLTSMTEGGDTYSYSYSPERDLNWITSDEYNSYFNAFAGVLYQKRNYGPNDTGAGLNYDSEYVTNTEYTYTADGNITREIRTNGTTIDYTYDKMGRLVLENSYDGIYYWYSYTYDASGNRASMTAWGIEDDTYTENYTYDANNRMTSKTKTAGETVTTTTYTYDNNGNLLTEQTGEDIKQYTYDKKNRLIGYTAGGVTASYTYSLTGKRESKTVNGETIYYAWLGDNLIAEYNEDGVTKKYVYDQTGILKAYTSDTANPELYYLKDGHGNAETLLKPDGTVYEDYQYTAFGTTLENSTIDNPFRYCGEYYDTETGLTYLRNRYYSSEVGRFITEDPHWNINNMIYGDKEYQEGEIRIPDTNAIIQSGNLYPYCMNNPVMYRDPNGNAGKKRYVDARHNQAYYTFLGENDEYSLYSERKNTTVIKNDESASKVQNNIEFTKKSLGEMVKWATLQLAPKLVGDIVEFLTLFGGKVKDPVGRVLNVDVGDTVYETQRSYHVDDVQYTEVEYKIVDKSGKIKFHDAYLFPIYN